MITLISPLRKSVAGVVLLACLGLCLIRQWVWMPVVVSGCSMEPTLRSGQLAGVNKVAYRCGSPRRGDIVVVWTGQDLVIKRIVGLPGEEIAAQQGRFWINGKPLPEPYVQLVGLGRIAAGKLNPDCFAIAGDNRCESFVAVVHRGRIKGRLLIISLSAVARSYRKGSPSSL